MVTQMILPFSENILGRQMRLAARGSATADWVALDLHTLFGPPSWLLLGIASLHMSYVWESRGPSQPEPWAMSVNLLCGNRLPTGGLQFFPTSEPRLSKKQDQVPRINPTTITITITISFLLCRGVEIVLPLASHLANLAGPTHGDHKDRYTGRPKGWLER